MKIELTLGDMTKQTTEAMVNAANTSLLGGGGVDGAIHRAGGKDILNECIKIRNRQGGCKTGEAVITTAGNLPSKFVIHTVGPKWHMAENNEENLLAKCYLSVLELAVSNKIKTIAFPNISTGIYGFPKDKAAKIAIETINSFPEAKQIDKIIFVCFDKENYTIYNQILNSN